MKISNILHVILMGWITGVWINNDYGFGSVLISLFILSVPMLVSNIENKYINKIFYPFIVSY